MKGNRTIISVIAVLAVVFAMAGRSASVSKTDREKSRYYYYEGLRQMAADLGVNAMTVSKAYQLLKAEGFIETDRRKGSIVCIPEKEYPTQQAAFEEKLEDELELLTAEAKIRGMDKGQFIQFCQHIFEEMEMVPE